MRSVAVTPYFSLNKHSVVLHLYTPEGMTNLAVQSNYPTMKNWYIRNNDEHLGPYSLEELKMVGLYSDDYVWKEGLPKWTRAETIPELKESLISVENYLFVPESSTSVSFENGSSQREQNNSSDSNKKFLGAYSNIASVFKRMLS